MDAVIEQLPITRSEAGDMLAGIVVTRESNGFAVWFRFRHSDPVLITWVLITPARNTAGCLASARVEARRIADEAVRHGIQYAECRSFKQR